MDVEMLGAVTRELARTTKEVAALQIDVTKGEARFKELATQIEFLRSESESSLTTRRVLHSEVEPSQWALVTEQIGTVSHRLADELGMDAEMLGSVTRELARTTKEVAALQMDATKGDALLKDFASQIALLRSESELALTTRRREDDATLQSTLEAVHDAVQRERSELAALANEAAQSAGQGLERVGKMDSMEAELQELRRMLDKEAEQRAQADNEASRVAKQSMEMWEQEMQESLAQFRRELQAERDQRAVATAELLAKLDQECAARKALRSDTAESLATAAESLAGAVATAMAAAEQRLRQEASAAVAECHSAVAESRSESRQALQKQRRLEQQLQDRSAAEGSHPWTMF